MIKIIADDNIPFLKGVFEPVAEVCYLQGASIKRENLKDADALIVRTRTQCNADLLKNSPVQMVVTATIGTDHFDIPWMNKAGIKWANAPGCNSGSVYQYIASALALLIIKERMKPEKTTIGIVGVGMVGSKIEKLAHILGMKVLLNDPPRQRKEKKNKFCTLKTILHESDIVTFHTPLKMSGEDATFHLFNKNELQDLKPGAIIINSSRGEVTDSHALLKGLNTGIISRVVLDVWENEPEISLELLNRVWIGTPHIAGYSADGKANGTMMAVRAISRHFNLGMDNWQPVTVEVPDDTNIRIDFSGKTDVEIVAEAILRTCNILDDDVRLRANPVQFEKQRGNYPLRREFETWKVLQKTEMNNGDVSAGFIKAWNMLDILNFRV
ncbi:MAG: 4-phosphoerythronate dehydrogenase [Cytophagaceae bacterium]|jgi:erythronate-4-phosphate dehydrogenase|nr:4-phosphoerythronate dehydrogenase [Cytophagaceae bacterium]